MRRHSLHTVRKYSLLMVLGVSLMTALVLHGIRSDVYGQVGKCGNGRLDAGEQCDDANLNNRDGCSTGCAILTGWVCRKEASVCRKTCGNGRVESANGEQCDDGNNGDGDGCSAACMIESGFICTGKLSQCTCGGTAASCRLTACGNSVLSAGEECDDGNIKNADGCSDGCAVEAGYVCRTEKTSVCSKDVTGLLNQQTNRRRTTTPSVVRCVTPPVGGAPVCFRVGSR